MKFRLFPLLCWLFLFSSCMTHSNISKEDKSIAESDKALFDNLAKEKIQDAQKKWPQFTEREIIAILQKQIYVGMRKSAMLVSWGKPIKTSSSRGKSGTIEQFVYPGKTKDEVVYVYVQKNLITGWQK